MPNWTYNSIKMNNIANEELFSAGDFDFDKIIPEPKDINTCPIEYIVKGDEAINRDKGREWFNWYKWRNIFWGTKWNACDTYVEDDDHVQFNTAWSSPEPIYKELSKMFPDRYIDIYVEFEDGDAFNLRYRNGRRILEREV